MKFNGTSKLWIDHVVKTSDMIVDVERQIQLLSLLFNTRWHIRINASRHLLKYISNYRHHLFHIYIDIAIRQNTIPNKKKKKYSTNRKKN